MATGYPIDYLTVHLDIVSFYALLDSVVRVQAVDRLEAAWTARAAQHAKDEDWKAWVAPWKRMVDAGRKVAKKVATAADVKRIIGGAKF